jgi:hypothetical protein
VRHDRAVATVAALFIVVILLIVVLPDALR